MIFDKITEWNLKISPDGGLCNAAYRRQDGVFVVPITALKP